MEIVTKRLVLRELTELDLAALVAYHADPRYGEFCGPDEAQPGQARELLQMFRQWAVERPRRNHQLAIARGCEPRELVGCCGVRGKGLDSGKAEFGIELAPRWWGHGYGVEAAGALLGFGFSELGLEELRGFSVSGNARVASLVRRLGFIVVGKRSGPGWMSTRGWSQMEWQITRERWEARARAAV